VKAYARGGPGKNALTTATITGFRTAISGRFMGRVSGSVRGALSARYDNGEMRRRTCS
jgi:hypothetical protein